MSEMTPTPEEQREAIELAEDRLNRLWEQNPNWHHLWFTNLLSSYKLLSNSFSRREQEHQERAEQRLSDAVSVADELDRREALLEKARNALNDMRRKLKEADIRHADEIREAKEEAWDEAATFACSFWSDGPLIGSKIRNANPHRLPPSTDTQA